jgi:hypothetical protein
MQTGIAWPDACTAPSIVQVSAFLISKDGHLKCLGYKMLILKCLLARVTLK